MSLQIYRAKPNPFGKDRSTNYVPSQKLAGEWIDIKNIGPNNLQMQGRILQHVIYPQNQWDNLFIFPNLIILPNQIIRVHSGGNLPTNQMEYIDQIGADFHLFTGKGYAWNNSGDTARVLANSQPNSEIDRASYSQAPEGRILNRYFNILR